MEEFEREGDKLRWVHVELKVAVRHPKGAGMKMYASQVFTYGAVF